MFVCKWMSPIFRKDWTKISQEYWEKLPGQNNGPTDYRWLGICYTAEKNYTGKINDTWKKEMKTKILWTSLEDGWQMINEQSFSWMDRQSQKSLRGDMIKLRRHLKPPDEVQIMGLPTLQALTKNKSRRTKERRQAAGETMLWFWNIKKDF